MKEALIIFSIIASVLYGVIFSTATLSEYIGLDQGSTQCYPQRKIDYILPATRLACWLYEER